MSDSIQYQAILCDLDGERLDRFLSDHSDLSRNRAAQLIAEGNVLVNGSPKEKNFKLSFGDKIEFQFPEDQEIEAIPEEIDLDIVFEDSDIIIVNKPQGMVVHPAPGNPSGTLVNALLFHCKDSLSGINGKIRPGIVHRIDKDTSGLIVVAKNDTAHNELAKMFADHSFQRKYHAIIYGAPKNDEGTIELAIGRSKKDRKKMSFYPPNTPNTKNAITHYRVLERFDQYSYVELTLETGRTHQIRVHMLSISCPVLADPVYASNRKNLGLSGQCLHAKIIGFSHPITKEELYFDSPLPDYFENTLSLLRKK